LRHLDVHRQSSAGMWEFSSYTSGESLELTSVNLSIAVDRVYDRVQFDVGL
jgi:hypothetical protein